MSELLFDKEGEPVERHDQCAVLRVRVFHNPGGRGTCATVRDEHGAPLYVDPDLPFLEFKRAVGGDPGHYRLDQCDASRQPIPGAAAAYVTILSGARGAASGGDDDPRDGALRELARANADMCRTIATQASDMMRAAAELMRAADGAGLPRRQPPPPLAAPEPDDDEEEDDDEDDDDDDDDDDEPQAPPSAVGEVLALVKELMPLVQGWLAMRLATRQPPAAASGPTPTPAPPAAEPAEPSAAGAAGAAAGPGGGPDAGPPPSAPPPDAAPSGSSHAATPPPAQPAGTSAGTSPPPPPPSPPPSGSSPPAGPSGSATAPPSAPRTPSTPPASAPRNASPTPEQIAHVLAIRTCLTPREAAVADAVVARMSNAERADWLAELSTLTVQQAVDLVRSMIPTDAKQPPRPPRPPKQE